MRPIPAKAVDFVALWEGCELVGYEDVVGIPTIGYGHTGPEVVVGQKITLAKAKALLKGDLIRAATRIHGRIGDVIDDLTQAQFTALLSFVFNLGDGDPKKTEWTIWKVLRSRQFDEVPAQLMRFVNAGGKRVRGLVNRRMAEVRLWVSDGADEPAPPSSVTRHTPTPPTPTNSKPLRKSKSFNAQGAATASGGLTATVAVAKDTLEPYAGMSESLDKVLVVLVMLTLLLTVTGLVLTWMKKRQANR